MRLAVLAVLTAFPAVAQDGCKPHTVRPEIEADWRVVVNGIGIGDGAEYLRNNVILGSGSFVEPATIERFREAVERKLGRELVGF